MSGGSSNTYRGYTNLSERLGSTDKSIRESARMEREARIRAAAEGTSSEPARERAKSASPINRSSIDISLAKNELTVPPKEAEEVHIFAIDNSGSNQKIAESILRAVGYIHANAGLIAGNAAIAFQFFSDHCDGNGIWQYADYVMPGDQGEKILRASTARIHGAGGGDAPEAIECALHELAILEFGHIPKEQRHLYLVTDVVAHGMGYKGGDDGCPVQKDWRESIREVNKSFETFQVIASGSDAGMFELQKQFITKPNRQKYDLVDLATGQLTHEERCRLVPNTLLFMVARNRGMQAIELFFSTLFMKWVSEPQYGSKTVSRARRQITEFSQYLEISEDERRALLDKVFAGTESD